MKKSSIWKTALIAVLAVYGATITVWKTSLFFNRTEASSFQPPPDSAIPAGKFGVVVRFGEQIFRDPAKYASQFVGNQLRCSNCHLEAGRQSGASPLWAAYTAYPAYRSKNGHVNSFEERLQGCFRYSMNGKVPKLGDPVLVALESYAYFLAKGLPTGETAPGRGFPPLPKPPLSPDYSRGAEVYAKSCASCHGAEGQGQSSDGQVVFPPLWGPQSYNWGAGMTSIKNAAEFIRANMPLGLGGTLTAQQSWDVAAFIDSQVRPQDPRFTGDIEQTRKKYHNSEYSMYGRLVNGGVLGDPALTPPSGTAPSGQVTKAEQAN
jgi:thiosulfate dehydrogenase